MTERDDTTGREGGAAMSCDRTINIGAYLLGGLPDDEARSMRSHIDTCTTCTFELRSLRPVADLLDSTELASSIIAERIEPSGSVRARLLSVASLELLNETTAAAATSTSTSTSTSTVFVSPSSPGPHRRTRQLIGASAVAFVLGASSVLGVQRLVADEAPVRPGERIEFTPVSLSSATPSTVADPNKKVYPKIQPRGWVRIEQQAAGTYAWLYINDLQVGRTYKWWFIARDGTRVGLGSFRFPKLEKGEEWLRCPGHTAIDRSELIAIGATDEWNNDVIRQELPKAPKATKT